MQLETSMRAAGATPSNETLTVLLSSLGRAHAGELASRFARRLLSDGRNGDAYDLPLYNCLMQSMLREGTDADVSTCPRVSTAPPASLRGCCPEGRLPMHASLIAPTLSYAHCGVLILCVHSELC